MVECMRYVFVQRGGRDVTFDNRYFGFGGWAAGYIHGDGWETLGWLPVTSAMTRMSPD